MSNILDNWQTFILLPIVLGVAANLLTPLFRKLTSQALFSLGQKLRVISKRGTELR